MRSMYAVATYKEYVSCVKTSLRLIQYHDTKTCGGMDLYLDITRR